MAKERPKNWWKNLKSWQKGASVGITIAVITSILGGISLGYGFDLPSLLQYPLLPAMFFLAFGGLIGILMFSAFAGIIGAIIGWFVGLKPRRR